MTFWLGVLIFVAGFIAGAGFMSNINNAKRKP